MTALAADPRSPATLYAGATRCGAYGVCEGPAFKTTNGAATWTQLSSGPDTGISALAVDPSSPSTVYAGAGFFLFKTTDGGTSWTQLGLPYGKIPSIAVAPGSPSTVYVTTGVLYRSTDGGVTWSIQSTGIPPEAGVSSLVIDPLSPRVLFAGTNRGVYRSADGGDNWWPLNAGLDDLYVTALALDPTDSILYAGTRGSGAFMIHLENGNAGLCLPSASALCLEGARFRVEVSFRTAAGISGSGQALPITTNTGAFWFFSPDNLEVVVKVLDGRSVNGRFWVFYGALSNVQYTITVTDTETGAVKTYFNP